jgi:hypothetical protein
VHDIELREIEFTFLYFEVVEGLSDGPEDVEAVPM